MKKNVKFVAVAAVMVFGCAAFAGPHHHHKRDGLDLAYGIVDLVMRVVAPQPVVVAPAPQPVVVAPTPGYYRPAPPPPPVYYRPAPPPPRHNRPAPPPRHNNHRQPRHRR